ncbi:yippee putative zinc-binding protein [Cooperia oncophora]
MHDFLVVLAPKYRHWFFPRMKVLESSNKDNQTQKTKTFQHYLPEGDRCYSCVHCRANLASHNDLISKSFQGSQGKAYLFNSVVNIGTGPAEERVLLTGLHAVADIYCQCCKTTLGWKYVSYSNSWSFSLSKSIFVVPFIHFILTILEEFFDSQEIEVSG